MELDAVLSFLNQYGFLFVFIVILLEYLNLPGFPAGVIYPAVGVWVSISGNSVTLAIIISVVAGLVGSTSLFFIGKKQGYRAVEKIESKYPATKKPIAWINNLLIKHGTVVIILATLLPVIRTIIPFVAGSLKMNAKLFILFSMIGITIWNAALILIGIFIPELVNI